jgi:ABC-type antimicrobial peptide transport system permease subunit
VLTTLGIVIGVAAVILLVGLGNGMKAGFSETFGKMATQITLDRPCAPPRCAPSTPSVSSRADTVRCRRNGDGCRSGDERGVRPQNVGTASPSLPWTSSTI